jgi:DNA-binding MarR family transcriptional regulator
LTSFDVGYILRVYTSQPKGEKVSRGNSANLDLNGTGFCASFNFRRTARAVTKLYDTAFQGCGIRSTQFTILVGIAKTQPTSLTALSEVLVIDRTTLTRSLRLLQKQGLIDVSARAAMRQRFVSLTSKGEQTLRKSVPGWRKTHEKFVKAVGSEYWINLRRELERLAHTALKLERSHSHKTKATANPD